ncbi:MAG: efflux RND transporter periplasmic adaptor subunit [Polyangiaceae bacterium]
MTLPASTDGEALVEHPNRDLNGTSERASTGVAKRPRLFGWGTGGFAALGLLFLTGYWQRRQEVRLLAEESASAAQAARRVNVVTPRVSDPVRALSLPATLEGLEQTEVDARANGYVRSWTVDLGDTVEQGQLLAELDTPELDRELEQARARLAQSDAAILEAGATRDFSLANLARYHELAPQGIASQQELEQKASQSKVDEAHLAVARADRSSQLANLHRLEQLKLFARVVAPFAGIITERTVARGKLVSAGAGQHLFKIAALDPMRAFVQVPQSLISGLKAGLSAEVRLAEQRNKVWTGAVARTASALDAASRTMSVEVRVPNADHALLPGMYVDVSLKLVTPQRTLVLPGSAIATNKEGVRVAIVGDERKVRWVKVRVERDNGAEVEISEGLAESATVIASPGPEIRDGMQVQPLR